MNQTADPLTCHWWKAVPNFGDAINPLILSHMSGRPVRHAPPKKAQVFAIGSLLQVVRRAYHEGAEPNVPVIWGTGLLHPVPAGFRDHVEITLVRGPVTAALLGLEADAFGDPGLLISEVLPFEGERGEAIGIVPHHSIADDALLESFEAPFVVIDPRADASEVCQQIARCRHVYASSLHGLIVADAYGVPNTWVDPEGQGRLKYHDYAASVGRYMPAPIRLEKVAQHAASLTDEGLAYQTGIDACRRALHHSFPAFLKADPNLA